MAASGFCSTQAHCETAPLQLTEDSRQGRRGQRTITSCAPTRTPFDRLLVSVGGVDVGTGAGLTGSTPSSGTFIGGMAAFLAKKPKGPDDWVTVAGTAALAAVEESARAHALTAAWAARPACIFPIL